MAIFKIMTFVAFALGLSFSCVGCGQLGNSGLLAPSGLGQSTAGSSSSAASNLQTIFTTQQPDNPNHTDGPGLDYELGVKFSTTVAGTIVGIRFYKSPMEGTPHTGNLWDASGNLLATVAFTNETASGWQEQDLTTPVAISANTIYVASVNTTNAYFANALVYSTDSAVTNGDLQTIAGIYSCYSTPGIFPTNMAGAQYFRDVVFSPGP